MTTDTLRAAAQNDEVGALIDRLEALADPEKEAVPSFADTDWRSLSWTCAKALRAALAAPVQGLTYSSTQATKCAGCGQHKHTPLRIDAMDGYVCLTCIDRKLGSLLGEFGYPEPEQSATAAPQAAPAVPAAWLDVLAERRHQVEAEGWTPEHDDEHSDGEMAKAAACYAHPDIVDALGMGRLVWPWDWSWWKPTDQRRNLIKAAALLLAEIERLDRAARPQAGQAGQGERG